MPTETNPVIARAVENSIALARAALPASRARGGKIVPLHHTHPITDSGVGFVIWLVDLPIQYTLDDAMCPELWKRVESQLRQRGPRRPKARDLIRIVRNDASIEPVGNFDAIFRIDEVEPNVGYHLSFYCGRLPTTEGQF